MSFESRYKIHKKFAKIDSENVKKTLIKFIQEKDYQSFKSTFEFDRTRQIEDKNLTEEERNYIGSLYNNKDIVSLEKEIEKIKDIKLYETFMQIIGKETYNSNFKARRLIENGNYEVLQYFIPNREIKGKLGFCVENINKEDIEDVKKSILVVTQNLYVDKNDMIKDSLFFDSCLGEKSLFKYLIEIYKLEEKDICEELKKYDLGYLEKDYYGPTFLFIVDKYSEIIKNGIFHLPFLKNKIVNKYHIQEKDRLSEKEKDEGKKEILLYVLNEKSGNIFEGIDISSLSIFFNFSSKSFLNKVANKLEKISGLCALCSCQSPDISVNNYKVHTFCVKRIFNSS